MPSFCIVCVILQKEKEIRVKSVSLLKRPRRGARPGKIDDLEIEETIRTLVVKISKKIENGQEERGLRVNKPGGGALRAPPTRFSQPFLHCLICF